MASEFYKGSTRIVASGCYIPPERVKTDDLLAEINPARFGVGADYIDKTMGIKEVRHANNQSPSTLAAIAAKAALDECPINPDLIGMIIFCGIEGDYQELATAHIVQKLLGLNCPIAFDIKNACMGFGVGLQMANGRCYDSLWCSEICACLYRGKTQSSYKRNH